MGTVDCLANCDERDFLFDFDLFVFDLGWYVLFLEEVGHLDVNAGRACRHFDVDVRNVAGVAVGVEHVGVDQFRDLGEVAVREDAPVHFFEVFFQFVEARDVFVADFLVQVLHQAAFCVPFLLAQVKCFASKTVFDLE